MTGSVVRPRPSAVASGIGASICAQSKAPTSTLSRMLAQDTSRCRRSENPHSRSNPSSRAMIIGAQSSSGMKPA